MTEANPSRGAHRPAVVDAAIQPSTRAGFADLRPYLSSGWARRLEIFAPLLAQPRGPRIPLEIDPHGRFSGPDGAHPGSDPAFSSTQVFAEGEADYGVLVPLESLYLAEMVSVEETVQLAAAYNDYFTEHWLAADARYSLAITVSPHNAKASVAEIERKADDPRVVAVVLPLVGVLMGKLQYRPILEAAAAANLAVVTPSGHRPYETTPSYAGGAPADYIQRHCLLGGIGMSNVASLVLEGIFDSLRDLTVVFSGWGYGWLPHLMCRMDAAWAALPDTSKTTDTLPSETVRRHIRFITNIEEAPPHYGGLGQPEPSSIGAEETLMYGSDYPHWIDESPLALLDGLDQTARDRVLHDCAASTFSRIKAIAG